MSMSAESCTQFPDTMYMSSILSTVCCLQESFLRYMTCFVLFLGLGDVVFSYSLLL